MGQRNHGGASATGWFVRWGVNHVVPVCGGGTTSRSRRMKEATFWIFKEYLKDQDRNSPTVVKTDTLHLKYIHTETIIYEHD